jgi:hypothetical protein
MSSHSFYFTSTKETLLSDARKKINTPRQQNQIKTRTTSVSVCVRIEKKSVNNGCWTSSTLDGGKAGTTLYVYSFFSLLSSHATITDRWERERGIMCMPLISRCDVHTTMLFTTAEEERFIFHSRWSCVLYVHFMFIFWSAITTTMSNSKEAMTKKQQDDLASSFNSMVSFFLWE